MKKQVVDLFLYRWRYVLGYSALAILFLIAVTAAAVYAPGGVTQTEIDTLRVTNALAGGVFETINLPLHLLQALSLSLFGVSILTIKLPAILLSAVAAASMFFLLKRWFKSNIAVLSMLIMTATGQFIFVAQSATPHILYVVYTSLILLFASLIFQQARKPLLWKLSLAATIGLSLYTPYFLYINLGLLLAALIHPHTRHHIFKASQRKNWLISSVVFLAVISPLIYLCLNETSLLMSLIGSNLLNIDAIENLKALFRSYFWINPIVSNGQIVPIMDFSTLALIVLGVFSLFKQRHTARAYMIFSWLLLTLPLLIAVPELTVVATIPLFILLAIGVETLLSEWYVLFPKNPYARSFGLIFLIVLISLMVFSGIDRFVHGYRQMPEAAVEFNSDINLVKAQLKEKPVRTTLVTTENEVPLYEALDIFGKYDITTTTDSDSISGNLIVTRSALTPNMRTDKSWQLQRIVTNTWKQSADRLYLFRVVENKI